MAGLSPVAASEEQTTALKVLAQGADRAEADRARALLLTLKGCTSARIAQAFGVREDTVRLWRSDFSRCRVALKRGHPQFVWLIGIIRALSKFGPARPYIARFKVFSRLIWPSA